MFGSLLNHVRGVVFLGTPHRGSNSAYWASFVARALQVVQFGVGTNSTLLRDLQSSSKVLSDISQQWLERSTPLSIRTFYETDKLDFMSCLVNLGSML